MVVFVTYRNYDQRWSFFVLLSLVHLHLVLGLTFLFCLGTRGAEMDILVDRCCIL